MKEALGTGTEVGSTGRRKGRILDRGAAEGLIENVAEWWMMVWQESGPFHFFTS